MSCFIYIAIGILVSIINLVVVRVYTHKKKITSKEDIHFFSFLSIFFGLCWPIEIILIAFALFVFAIDRVAKKIANYIIANTKQ